MIATTQLHHELQKIVRGDEDNKKCADCNTPNPTWASINIGCFLCLECSGIHRNLGTHISKVRSTTLDTWNKSWVQHMRAVGNGKVNSYYEARLPNGFNHPSNLKDKNEFIRLKYQNKKWYGEPGGNSESNNRPSNAFGVSRKATPTRKAPETAAQRAKRRADERAKLQKEQDAARATNTSNQQTQQHARQQPTQQKAAPTSTLERFRASASVGTVPVVSPIAGRRKTSRSKQPSGEAHTGGVESAAARARRRQQQNQQLKGPSNNASEAASSMFDGLSSGGDGQAETSSQGSGVLNMFEGLSTVTVDAPRTRAESRESLEKNLAQRRPSQELQRLNILRSDPTSSVDHGLQAINEHMQLQQTRQAVSARLSTRPAAPSGFSFMGGADAAASSEPQPPTSSFGFLGNNDQATQPPASSEPASSGVSSAFGFLDSSANAGDGVSGAATSGSGASGTYALPESYSTTMPMDATIAQNAEPDANAHANVVVYDTEGQPGAMLKQHESSLEVLEQQCANIQTVVYQFEEARNQFLAAKSQLAQLNGDLERLQNTGIDAVVIQALPGEAQANIRAERKMLTQRVSFLFEQISITADYMSKLTV